MRPDKSILPDKSSNVIQFPARSRSETNSQRLCPRCGEITRPCSCIYWDKIIRGTLAAVDAKKGLRT